LESRSSRVAQLNMRTKSLYWLPLIAIAYFTTLSCGESTNTSTSLVVEPSSTDPTTSIDRLSGNSNQLMKHIVTKSRTETDKWNSYTWAKYTLWQNRLSLMRSEFGILEIDVESLAKLVSSEIDTKNLKHEDGLQNTVNETFINTKKTIVYINEAISCTQFDPKNGECDPQFRNLSNQLSNLTNVIFQLNGFINT